MTWFQALVLGVVQGLTEYLPVSSSAHLVLVPWWLGWRIDDRLAFPFDVLVHWGTLVPVLLYFRGDLREILRDGWIGLRRGSPFATPGGRLGGWVLLATLPTAVLGLLLKHRVEAVFLQPPTVAALLFGTGVLLWGAEGMGRQERGLDRLTARDALTIGLAQALSLLPGISRSGATIAAGLALGLARPEAARFSFLMSLPALLGAGGAALRDLGAAGFPPEALGPVLIGFAAAALSGYLAIWSLMRLVRRRSLRPFALYCGLLGSLSLALVLLRGGQG